MLAGPLDMGSEFERRLAIAATIAKTLRTAVFDRLGKLLVGFTMHGVLANSNASTGHHCRGHKW